MIVRISGENQYRLSDADAEQLNQLERAVVEVVEGGQKDGFDTAFRTLLEYVRAHGTPLGSDELEDFYGAPRGSLCDEGDPDQIRVEE